MVSVRFELPEVIQVPVYGGDDANPLTTEVGLDVTKLGPEAFAYLLTYGAMQQRDVFASVKVGGKRPDGTVVKNHAEALSLRVTALKARFDRLTAGDIPKSGGGGRSTGVPHWDTFRDVVRAAFAKRNLSLDLKGLVRALRDAAPGAKEAILRERVYAPVAAAIAGRAAKGTDIDKVAANIHKVVMARVKRAAEDLIEL